MKKIYVLILILIASFTFISCSSSSRITSEEIVDIVETLQLNEIDNTFYQELKNYNHRGDAYYLLGEKNEYIEVVMYYKQKYVELVIEFDFNDDSSLVIEQIYLEYFDLLDEIYVYFNANNEINTYDLNNKSYDDIFSELETLSIADIEWILTTLELM